MKLIDRLIGAAILVIVLLFPPALMAQEAQQGVGLICDTAEQVQDFVKAWDGDTNAALQKVNATDNVCGVLPIAYIRGEEVGQLDTKNGRAAITEILVIAINVGGGWVRGPPMRQYTLFLLPKDREA